MPESFSGDFCVNSGSDREPDRTRIAFLDYPDVFEDFYPHYGVDQRAFATLWAATGLHAFLSLLQQEVGDVTWYSQSLAPEIGEARHEVVGCRVKILPSSWLHRVFWRAFYLPRSAWRWRERGYRTFATIASYLSPASVSLIQELMRDRPDVFFLGSYSSGRFDVLMLVAQAMGVPLVAFHSGGEAERYLGKTVRRWTIPRADRFIVSGQAEREMLIARYNVPPERLDVILTPIDTEKFQPMERTEACRLAALDPGRRYILFVGRLADEVKRVSSIIRVFAALAARYPDADLLIVGEGEDSARLAKLASAEAPGRVMFLGWRSGAENLAPLYNSAECLLLPSRREGFPTVVGEAMACGTPVLASRVGGISELVVDDETGWLISPGDDEALAEKMAFVLEDPHAVAAMRPRVREMAESRVSRAAVSGALARCFSSAIAARR